MNFERVQAEERLASKGHTVRRGETLTHIAQRYGTTVRAIRDANVGIQPHRILVVQKIIVPGTASTTLASTTKRVVEPQWVSYRVRRGDTLWGKIGRASCRERGERGEGGGREDKERGERYVR